MPCHGGLATYLDAYSSAERMVFEYTVPNYPVPNYPRRIKQFHAIQPEFLDRDRSRRKKQDHDD